MCGLLKQTILISCVKIFLDTCASLSGCLISGGLDLANSLACLSWTTSVFHSCLRIPHPSTVPCLHSSHQTTVVFKTFSFCKRINAAPSTVWKALLRGPLRTLAAFPDLSVTVHSMPELVFSSRNTPGFPTQGSLIFLFFLHRTLLLQLTQVAQHYLVCLHSIITTSKACPVLP